ncbi:hypothetical protein KY290_021037 [Solanum tuberosum]|uniref:Helitron helicase-like domain-containing protein n=1 Tax=Solanum tuberosum TaxID=4113 RepID=A0ABQ7V0D6_SOLTU|nr:hypothetical protein KY285_019981 [Solanum tuberosum]KAH0757544.1 hypothetical protein KY290_021037 [Solanum tuberosum]
MHVLKTVPECIYCAAKRLEHEPPAFCYASGYIKLATTEAPTELYEMLVASTPDAVEFRKNICAYNSIFAFTSFGVNLDKKLASARKGVYTFKAQGQIYHDLPSLVPRNNNPCYFQLYFFDTDKELTNRLSKVNEEILSDQIAKKIKQDGYPIYKGRMNGRIETVHGMNMTNQWVVPYSLCLLTRYNCHINVEPDDGENVIDEIQTFQDERWVSPPEALWRIYEFNLTEMQPAVINLQLHLPGKHSANPREGERYYEQLLLDHVRGQLSFNDLLTVNGKQCQTFKEAAKERGLHESDNSISECLREVVIFKMPSALRSLFATILVHCNPTDIRKL